MLLRAAAVGPAVLWLVAQDLVQPGSTPAARAAGTTATDGAAATRPAGANGCRTRQRALREVEAAWAAAGDVVLDERAAKVHWKLPVPKTDPRAVSCTRSWGCTCEVTKAAVCPYHRFVSYLAKLCELFSGPGGKLPRDLPLLPTREGKVPLKEAVVVALEVASAAVGMLTIDTNGKRVLGGDTPSGSQARATGRGSAWSCSSSNSSRDGAAPPS